MFECRVRGSSGANSIILIHSEAIQFFGKGSMSSGTIEISGLTRLDKIELTQQLPSGTVDFKEEVLAGAKHGEPLTIILIAAITSASLGTLSAWLVKDRTSDRIRKTLRVTDPDGRIREETLDIDVRTSKAPNKDVLRALARICHINIDDFKENSAG